MLSGLVLVTGVSLRASELARATLLVLGPLEWDLRRAKPRARDREETDDDGRPRWLADADEHRGGELEDREDTEARACREVDLCVGPRLRVASFELLVALGRGLLGRGGADEEQADASDRNPKESLSRTVERPDEEEADREGPEELHDPTVRLNTAIATAQIVQTSMTDLKTGLAPEYERFRSQELAFFHP